MASSESVNSLPGAEPERSEAYFSSPELAQRADLLRHLTENSNLIPLVRGVEGIGKSSFISHLLDLAPQNWIPVEIIADVMLQPEALLAKLVRMYDLDGRGADLLDSLALHFDHLRQDGFLPVIIVDDVHLLPEASIITLLRLHERGPNDNPLAQILLFAQPEIDDLLKTPQLRVMNLQSLQLLDMPVFTREQTEHFLEHLLAADEFSSMHSPSPLQVEKIFRESGGLPGMIKQQAVELMGSVDTQKIIFDITEYIPTRTALGGGIALIVVLLGLIYQDSINSLFSDGEEMSEVDQEMSAPAGTTQRLALPDLTAESAPSMETAVEAGSELDGLDKGEANTVPGPDSGLAEGAVSDIGVADQPLSSDTEDGERQQVEQTLPSDTREQSGSTVAEQALLEQIAAPPELVEVPEPDPIEPEGQVQAQEPEKGSEPAKVVVEVPEERPMAGVSPPGQIQPMQTVVDSAVKPAVAKAKPAPEPPKTKVPVVSPKVESMPPKAQKSAAPIQADIKPVKPKIGKQVAKSKARIKAAVVSPKAKAPKPAPVIQVEERSSGLTGVRPGTPAPVEERSTHLVKKEAPAVKLVQKPVTRAGKSPVATKSKPLGKRQQAASAQPLREDWLMKQNPTSFTIQLLGLQAEKGISSFLRRHPLSGRVAYYSTKRNGKLWFPVLYGVYPDRKMAVQARDGLPETLRKSGVWLRTMGSVQKEIRAR